MYAFICLSVYVYACVSVLKGGLRIVCWTVEGERRWLNRSHLKNQIAGLGAAPWALLAVSLLWSVPSKARTALLFSVVTRALGPEDGVM